MSTHRGGGGDGRAFNLYRRRRWALDDLLGSQGACGGRSFARIGDTCSEGSFNPHPQSPLILGPRALLAILGQSVSGFLPLLNECIYAADQGGLGACLSQVYDGGGGGDVLLASYNDADNELAMATVSSGRKVPTKTTGQAAWLDAKHE